MSYEMLFILTAILGVFVARKWANSDGSTKCAAPSFTSLDPISIAALRGGTNDGIEEVIKTVLYRFKRQGLIELNHSDKGLVIKVVQPLDKVSSEIETAVYRTIAHERVANEVMWRRMYQHLEPTYNQLKNLRLIRNEKDINRVTMAFQVTLALVASVGIYGQMLDELSGEFFFISIIIYSLCSNFTIDAASKNRTQLGEKYLADLQGHFSWLKNDPREHKNIGSIDPAYIVAIFGFSHDGGNSMNGLFSEIRNDRQKSDSYDCGCGCG